MKTQDNEYEKKANELERIFNRMASSDSSTFPRNGIERSRDYESYDSDEPRNRYKSDSGKPRPSSVVCGILAGTFLICLGWNQFSMDMSRLATPAAVSFVPPVFTLPANTTYNDPHTIEGTAAIHKEMQSGTVNVSKSTITGIVDSESMTSSLYWTFVLKNNNSSDKEAAITMELPKNAALSRATLWINGVAQEAAFSSNQQVQNAYDSIVVRHRDPLLVTQIGPNKIKILAAPVTANGGTMQFRIGITAPAERGSDGKHFITMPHIVESNLKFDSQQDIHLDSDTRIAGIGNTERSGIYTLKANIPSDDLSKVKVETKQASADTFATRLTHTNPPEYLLAKIEDGELQLSRVAEKPSCRFINDEDAAFRLSNIWAHQEIERQAARGKTNEACDIANVYRIVSSVSGATVLEEQFDYSNNGLNRDMYRTIGRSSSSGNDYTTVKGFVPYSASGNSTNSFGGGGADAFDATAATGSQVQNTGNFTGSQTQQGGATSAPMLQGATFGTIGPQGSDATVIQGVNTAGTVRVNNLVYLEAALNLLANGLEILGIAIAAFLLSESAVNDGLRAPLRLSRMKTLFLGFAIGALGLATPGIINYVIASLRDCNFLS